MPQLLGIRIRNYKSLSDVTLGQIAYAQGEALPPINCFIGPNGSGKSTLIDAFGFLADCLKEGVETACDKPQRGGLSRLRTQGSTDPICFDLYYRENLNSRPITYSFEVGQERGVPVVLSEELRQRRKGLESGQPFTFLRLKKGKGVVWAGDKTEDDEDAKRQPIKMEDRDRLGITVLGQLSDHPRIVGLRAYIESWYLSYFVPDAARRLPPTGAQKHLDRKGENLGNVIQYLERNHKQRFNRILDTIRERIPGIKNIKTEPSPDGRLLLKFNESSYKDPFFQQSMSDGTLKMFAYLLLLQDPDPPAFIGIEEPENGLYHKLLETLAREFRRHAENSQGKIQVIVTTHSPYFVDALSPEQVWLLEKDDLGHTQATRTADMPAIKELVKEGIPLGSLWYSNHFEERSLG
ncbi:MAG: AAA family ATPase [Deltaproteobacteria bacterium]|nr:AAA family ATPase [Deltaproteobacteria bacterium]